MYERYMAHWWCFCKMMRALQSGSQQPSAYANCCLRIVLLSLHDTDCLSSFVNCCQFCGRFTESAVVAASAMFQQCVNGSHIAISCKSTSAVCKIFSDELLDTHYAVSYIFTASHFVDCILL